MREFDIIKEICAHNAELAHCGGASVLIPPGDDMALVALGGKQVLIAADQVIEGRHFTRGTSMELVARKALARNISDIAAMAAVPSCAVATVALPPGMPESDVRALTAGLRAAARHFRCPVVGGDIAVHPLTTGPLSISITVLAEPGPSGRVVTRSGACVGDHLCVTGQLGRAWHADGSGRHLSFTPRTTEALELVERLGSRLHAMIDISDGLGRDAAHLAKAAGLSLRIDGALLPCAPGADWRSALANGEDYELAFACEGLPPAHVAGTPITVVGTFVALSGTGGSHASVSWQGVEHDASTLGFEHGV